MSLTSVLKVHMHLFCDRFGSQTEHVSNYRCNLFMSGNLHPILTSCMQDTLPSKGLPAAYSLSIVFRSIRMSFTVEQLDIHLCIEYPPVALRQTKPAQEVPVFYKSFNMLKEYASHLKSGIREQIQNWYDQCIVMSPSSTPVGLNSQEANGVTFQAVVGEIQGQKRALGFVAQFLDSQGRRVVILKNYGTQLSPDQMSLGMTTKTDNDKLAGDSHKSSSYLLVFGRSFCLYPTRISLCRP